MALDGQDDDDKNGKPGSGHGEGTDKPESGTDKPVADGKEEGAEGKPETVEQAIRKALELEKPEDAGKQSEEKPEKPKVEVKPEAKKDEGKEKKADLYVEPEGLKEKSKERFQALVTSHKEQASQLGAMEQIIVGFRQMVKETGATEDQFVLSLDLLKLVNSNPAEAAKVLYESALNLAVANNVDIPGVDFLKDYPDLKRQAEDREITAEVARETAKLRREKATREASEREGRERQVQSQRQQQEERQTLGTIEAFLKDKEINDIDWTAKAPMLMRAAQFAAKSLPRANWLAYLQEQYEQVGEIVAKASKPANNGGSNRPLRPNAGAGGQESPSDMFGAIKQGLGL